MGGTALGFVLGSFLTRPVAGAPAEEKLEYLISLIEEIASLQNDNKTQNNEIISLLQSIAGAGGPTITIATPWTAKEPILLLDHLAIRAAGNYQSDRMFDIRNTKRQLIKAESSLDQAATIQIIGNIVDSFNQATNVGVAAVCPAGGNISFGLGWADWIPFIGININLLVAPTAGFLTIYAVEQE